jgi:replicative DNA helicase
MALSNIKKEFGTGRGKKTDLSAMVYGKIPPQAPELEEAVLGAVMLEQQKLADVIEIIQSPDCFYVEAHQRVYSAVRRLFDKGMPVDLLTVVEELRNTSDLEFVGGPYFITKLTNAVVSSANVDTHARIIMEKYIQRELIRISGEVIADAYEDGSDVFDLLDKAESGLYEITDKHLRKNFTNIKDVLIQTVKEIEEAKNRKDELTGIPSGFPSLDKITAGWQRTDLIILAARPSVGKTAFALNLALNAALNKSKAFPVAVFSLEMGATQLVKRLLSAETEVSMEKIVRGSIEEHEFVQLNQRMSNLLKAPIYLDDQAGLNVFELRAKCRRLKQKHDIQLIIIDYLQLMTASIDKGGNREQEISKISRDLKALAKELNVPVIALSQLSRAVENRKESKMPQLSDLRESGAIEQDADMVMFIYRPEYHGITSNEMGEPIQGETHINIAKHRNGKLGVVKLKARLEFQKFEDLGSDDDDFGGFQPFKPNQGMNRSHEDFGPAGGGPKVFVQDSGFQTLPSKANDIPWDDEDDFGGGAGKMPPRPPFDPNDTPF